MNPPVAEHPRLAGRSPSGVRAGKSGDRISPSVSGAPCARTTARTAMHGNTSRTTTRAAVRIAGARMVSRGSRMIGVFDRSAQLPTGGRIDQADGTSWMAMYALNLMRIALELAQRNPVYEDIA